MEPVFLLSLIFIALSSLTLASPSVAPELRRAELNKPSRRLVQPRRENSEQLSRKRREDNTGNSTSKVETVTSDQFNGYGLSLVEPKLCDPTVKQYSGYLDIPGDKHLFFWFFESKTASSSAPLILWLSGGPGISSTAALFFELGPCKIIDQGRNTEPNPYSWHQNANIIFLDQPINTGFSYSDNTDVTTSDVAGQDVYAFLQIFFNKFPEYSALPFHVAGESYGGAYAPNVANSIFEQNQKLAQMANPTSNPIHINLQSVVLGNGLTDPYVQFAAIPEYACGGAPYLVFKPGSPLCDSLWKNVPNCQELIKECYDFDTTFYCANATNYCINNVLGPLDTSDINLYDVRRKCNISDGPFCYKDLEWIATWLNDTDNKVQLGVDPETNFQLSSDRVYNQFYASGDWAHDSAALLPNLINGGVRLLVYAGNADILANILGNEQWLQQLPSQFHDEFNSSQKRPWHNSSGIVAGEYRSAGGGAGSVTFVDVHDAGHLVPHDQPSNALELITNWINNTPLS